VTDANRRWPDCKVHTDLRPPRPSALSSPGLLVEWSFSSSATPSRLPLVKQGAGKAWPDFFGAAASWVAGTRRKVQGVGHIVKLLEMGSHSQVQCAAADALRALCINNDGNKDAVREAWAIPVLVKILGQRVRPRRLLLAELRPLQQCTAGQLTVRPRCCRPLLQPNASGDRFRVRAIISSKNILLFVPGWLGAMPNAAIQSRRARRLPLGRTRTRLTAVCRGAAV
jgi:hypothetical protein